MRNMRALLIALAATLAFAAPASAQSPDLVISQVYGGGGNAGATAHRTTSSRSSTAATTPVTARPACRCSTPVRRHGQPRRDATAQLPAVDARSRAATTSCRRQHGERSARRCRPRRIRRRHRWRTAGKVALATDASRSLQRRPRSSTPVSLRADRRPRRLRHRERLRGQRRGADARRTRPRRSARPAAADTDHNAADFDARATATPRQRRTRGTACGGPPTDARRGDRHHAGERRRRRRARLERRASRSARTCRRPATP